jgi:hypothetical protein
LWSGFTWPRMWMNCGLLCIWHLTVVLDKRGGISCVAGRLLASQE